MTATQRALYEAIITLTAERGLPPTRRELATHCYCAPSTLTHHLKQMRAAGLVTYESGKARTLRVVKRA